MKVLGSRRLAALAGCAGLVFGVAGTAGAVHAQARVTAAVSQSQVVASWGTGPLGDAAIASRPLYGDVKGVSDVVQVDARYGHGLAVRSDGTVWAWGSNTFGELGDGTTTSRPAPVQVTGLTGVTQVAAGCSHSLALRSDGTVWAWGSNDVGQLGRGTVTGYEVTPAPASGLAGVVKIAAGCDFNLALRSDGTVRAWGVNSVGELGDGGTADSAVPVKAAGMDNVTDIAAGFDASVVTRTNGISVAKTVWTWGENGAGQLGDGTVADRLTPVQVTGIGTAYIAGVAAGFRFTAVLGTDGRVWAWGDDSVGQLGNARTSTLVTRPVNTIGPGKGITQISAGQDLMVALVSDGTVLAWGDNTNGELGTGTATNPAGPVQVTGLTGATQVAAGQIAGFAVHAMPLITVPDLTGDTQAQAGQVLQAAGLVLGAVTKVADKYCAHLGTVMTENPAAGTAVSPGSAVSVTIGQAPSTGCP